MGSNNNNRRVGCREGFAFVTNKISNASLSLLRQRTSRLTNCWRIERADGVTHQFTVHDQVLNQSWAIGMDPRPGLSNFANRRVTGLASRSTEISGIISDDGITYDDLMQGRVWGSRISQSSVDWAFPFVANLIWNTWYVNGIEYDDKEWRMTLVGITSRLLGKRGETFGRTCQNELGKYIQASAGSGYSGTSGIYSTCPVRINDYPFKVPVAVIQSGATKRVFNVVKSGSVNGFGDASHETYDNYFSKGYVQLLDGENKEMQETILTDKRVDASTRTITLMRPLPTAPAVNDTCDVFVGCDKNVETCRDKFDALQGHGTDKGYSLTNYGGFRGFPEIPGTDESIRYPLPPGQ
jgi:uncharacterized phage protein (TIGR02218 family)